jgi:hypothetical protein
MGTVKATSGHMNGFPKADANSTKKSGKIANHSGFRKSVHVALTFFGNTS